MTEPHTRPEPVDAGSLASIDVGFDLRLHEEMDAALPVAPLLTVAHDGIERPNRRTTTTGTPADVGWTLQRLGYRIRWTWEGMPDGYMAEVVTDADGGPVLVMRDPNEGIGSDAAHKTRYEYHVSIGGLLTTRRLPPEGDTWRGEPAPPWWEPVRVEQLARRSILLDWQRACTDHVLEPWRHRHATAHIVAFTPNGRELRWRDDGKVELQPPLDNWWHICADLEAARRWWYEQAGS